LRGQITPEGIWVGKNVRMPRAAFGPGLFLDRDGTIIEDGGYLRCPVDVKIQPGAVELLLWAKERELPAVVITNQSGIGRGYFDWKTFELVEEAVEEKFAAFGVFFALVVACPFHAETMSVSKEKCAHWRKPGPGMLLAASERLNISRSASWIIGDKSSDSEAGLAAGLRGAIWLRPEGRLSAPESSVQRRTAAFEELTCSNLLEARQLLRHKLDE